MEAMRHACLAIAAAGLILGSAEARTAIVSGHSIGIQEAPWQMHLDVALGGGTSSGCGAVWIGKRWVVTAAHCVEDDARPDNTKVVGGVTTLNNLRPTQLNSVKRIIMHPEWGRQWRDIALLELGEDVKSALARPIGYVTEAGVRAGLTNPGTLCMATGWGAINRDYDWSDSLQSVTSRLSGSQERYVINWGGYGKVEGSCQGDSGGPLVVRDASGEGWLLAGISSFISDYCGHPDKESSYARVSAFTAWIEQYTGAPVVDTRPPVLPPKPLAFRGGRLVLDPALGADLPLVDATGAAAGGGTGPRFHPMKAGR